MTDAQSSGPEGILYQIWRTLGQLEEGVRLNRKASEERTTALRDHVDQRIDDLISRVDRLEQRPTPISPSQMSFWSEVRQLPWRHMAALAGLAGLGVSGHFTAPEIKALLLRFVGVG